MKRLAVSIVLVHVLSVCWAEPIALYDGEAPPIGDRQVHRERRAAGGTERDCSQTPPYHPSTAVNTTAQLAKIREYMVEYGYAAYIVPSEDAHGSEYIAEPDRRRQYISGFSGSAGLAVVTANAAAAWTDGRYFIQADRELWCDWTFMKSGQPGVPSTSEWLVSTESDPMMGAGLTDGSKIGFDPTLMSISTVQSYMETITDSGRNLEMVGNVTNMVDLTWAELGTKPGYPEESLLVLEMMYTGQTWQDKIGVVRTQLAEAEADKLIVPKLDEVAWLFNLRGKDIPYNPMFISYAIVGTNDLTLYAYDKAGRIDADSNVLAHLDLPCSGSVCVTVKDYDQFAIDLPILASGSDKIWFSDLSSYFIFESIPEANRYIEASPILLTKAQKNTVEIEGMKEAHRLDSVALCELGGWLKETVDSLEDPAVGDIDVLSELIVMDKAIAFREEADTFQGLSFGTISSFGANGAVIHYTSSEATNVPITNQGIFLLDSGGQYNQGTCDITRSFHFGTPTVFMKEAYTRVLMGHIDLVQAVFRTGVYGRELDALARGPLWSNGLDYRHGTGHGIGHFLNVHEGPGRINLGYSKNHEPIHLGFFFSDEPGYYEDGEFGIRIEDIMYAVEAETDNHFNDYTYMTFDMISYVPLETSLIDFSLMTKKQIEWYNTYNKQIKDNIRPTLTPRGQTWVDSKTAFVDPESLSAGTAPVATFALVLVSSVIAVVMQWAM